MTRYVIALLELGISNNDVVSLLSECPNNIKGMFDPEKYVFENSFRLMRYFSVFENTGNVSNALEKADIILQRNKELGIKTTYYTASTYPEELAKIDNPPAVIYYKGAEFNKVSNKIIACVGTRKPSKFSYNAVNYLIPQWVNEDCAIASGLACGVDKISHQACITAGGKTIAVLAHGLDMIYPKENSSLADRILESGGILMSEYPVGTHVEKYRLVNRNRLIVGMAKAVVIFECDAKSGTIHNAEYAAKQHKPIFCPYIGKVNNEVQTGTKHLIDKKIATVIKQGRDISSVLEAVGAAVTKERMSNIQIKFNYLQSVLSIIQKPIVLKATLQDMHLNIPVSSDMYSAFVDLFQKKQINIDVLISTLVENNIVYGE